MGRNKGKKKPQSQGDQLGESSGGPPQGPEGSQPGSRPQGQSSSQGTQQAEPREARGPQGDQSRKGRKGKSHGQEEKHVQQRQDQPPRPQQQQGQQLQFDPTRMQSSQGQQQQSQPQPARQAWGQRQPTPQDAPQSFGPPGFVAQPRPTFPAPFQQGRGETHSELGRGRPGFASPPPHQQLPAQGGRGKKHPGPPQQQPGTPSPVSPHHQPPAQGGSRQKYPGPPQQQPGAPSQVPPHQQPPAQGGWGQKRPGPPQQQPGAPSQEPQHQQRPVQGGRGQRHPGQQQPVQGGRGQRQTGQPQQQPGVEPPSTSSQSVSRVEQGISGLQISSPRQSDTGDAEIVSKIKIKPGTKGRIIKVESNHLELRLGNLKVAYHYDVNIIPDKPKKFMRPVVESWRKKHFPRRYPAFDGKKNLYTSSPLTNNLNDFIQDDITILEDDGREKQFRIEIKFANEVDMTPLRDFLNSPVTPQEAIQVVDIVLRMAPVAKCLPVGRSFFMKPQRIIDLGQGMEMYNGFYQSAVRGWKPFLNVDVAHKAFPKEINVIDALYELIDTRGQDLTSLGPRDEETLRKFIKTLRISYQIPNHPETKKCYRVNGLGQTAQRAIFKHENKDVSIFDYFLRYKNYRLRFPNLPTLWVGNAQKTDKILLPLELCTICADQAVNRKMTDLQTSKMIRYAATDTATRKDKIVTSIRNANYNDNPTVQEFGFSVGSEFQKLDARVLQPPMILYDQNRTARVARGVWRNELFLKPATIENWTIMCVGRYPLKPDEYKSMTQLFGKAARDCGIKFTKGPTEPFKCLRENYRDIEQFFRNEKSKFDVIFVIVPDSGPTYSYVKKAAEIAVGCLTQCIKTFTARRKMNPQTAVNILLKVNSKLNGINHSLSPQTKPLILNRPVMIMGADVTHPGPDSRNIPSVAAVTASHDPTAFKYNICWRLQNPKMEIIEDLEEIVREQLMYFYHANKCKPEAIVFFRDGVSEGQFEQVKKTEIFAIRRACKTLQAEGYEPKITFLVVQKRHHTRLFPLDPRDSEDKNKNVPAGGCKHAVAFLFWLHRRSEEPSVTSKECYWKASKLSKMGTAVKYMALKDMHEDITPKDESILEDLLEQLGKQKGGIFDFYNTNELSKFDLYDLILSYKEQKNQYDADEFIQFASKMMECNLAEVEKRTRDQSSSKEWFQMRFGRITASKIYEAAKCKTSAGSLMESIMGGVRPLETEPVKRGKQLEPAVIKRVEKMKGISIRKCGLLLNNNYPMLGASPDGLSNNYCIEVKCPSKEKNIENYVKDGIVNKRYYYQLQIQLFFANKTKGLFCVASPSFETNREVQITEVEFNEDESTEIMNAAMDYWKNCVFPVLCDM